MESKQGSSSQTGHEPKWPSVINTLATAGLFYSLPEQLTPGPKWLVPAIVCVLLVLTVAASTKGKLELHFVFGVTMQSMLTVAEAWSLTFLIVTLPAKHQPAAGLMRSAGAIWVSNILIFASWYWRLDAGGPYRRNMRDRHSEGAFLFPQMTVSPESPLAPRSWKPGFIDYLFLAFCTSTAFSPTDTPVLSRWAKGVMMVQSAISLGTIAILLSRAISLL